MNKSETVEIRKAVETASQPSVYVITGLKAGVNERRDVALGNLWPSAICRRSSTALQPQQCSR